MTGYLIDTSVVVDVLRDRLPAIDLLRELDRAGYAVNAVTAGEVAHGIARSKHPLEVEQRFAAFLSLIPVLAFDLETARIFGGRRARLQELGLSIGDLDLMIAATAIQHDLTMVTWNRRHVERVDGLRLLSPEP